MTWEIVVGLIGIVTGVAGMLFGFVSMQRNKKADSAGEGKQIGIVLTEIGYIKSGVDRMERKQDDQEKRHLQLSMRLEGVDASAKQAHKRIDGLEKRVDTLADHQYHEERRE